MKEMSAHLSAVDSVQDPGEADEDVGDDDQEAKRVGVGGNDDHHKLQHVHQLVHGVLHGVDDSPLRLLHGL